MPVPFDENKWKHGPKVDGVVRSRHKLYSTWRNMMRRRYVEGDTSWENYGARGITVCERWHDFANFAADMGPKPNPCFSIERVGNNGNYEPSNCIWGTPTEQAWNRRTFKNNTSGRRGVIRRQTPGMVRFVARFDYEGVRHVIGHFDTTEEAALKREEFIELFFRDRAAALKLLEKETVWCNAKTGIRGITPHVDGGYVVRCTIDKKRHYVGYYQDIREAERARLAFIEANTL